jgi:hypothetical protein
MKAAIETQVCTKCGLEKPLSEYYVRKDKNIYRRDCKTCQKKRGLAYREANREKIRAVNKARYRANPEKRLAQNKAWQKANREKYNAILKAWAKANPEKRRATYKAYREANREKIQAYYKANREKSRAQTAKRRAAKLKATPAWADLRKIQDFYEACPPGHHVDHYFPLISPIMCGLHVESNLRYLPAKENFSKGNRVTLQQQLNG